MRAPSSLLPFGELVFAALCDSQGQSFREDKSSIFTDSTALKSEVEYPSAFGGFEMSPYSSVGELAQEGAGLYNSVVQTRFSYA